MATLDLQEQEQVDAFKAWWKANSKWVLLALVLAIGGAAAVQGWHAYKDKQTTAAATLYTELVKQVPSNDARRINDAAAAVMEQYASSGYAPRAALLAAQVNIQAKDTARARTQLQWVIEHADEATLKDVARLKLASLLLDEKDYAAAMTQLDAAHPEAFTGLYADLKGDVLSAQGKTAEARAAYREAYAKTDAKSMYRNLIQMKLDGLGEETQGAAK